MADFGRWWGEDEGFAGDDLKVEGQDSWTGQIKVLVCAMKIWFIFTKVDASTGESEK